MSQALRRRDVLAATAGALAAPWVAQAAGLSPGVTSTSIKIGQTMPYSGPASAYGVVGRTQAAVFRMLNAAGGINGRRIDLISADDGYSPPRTVEETRRLVESEGVAFMFAGLGTPTQTAVHQYLNDRKVPQLFITTGAEKWADPEHFPWTIGWNPSYRMESRIYVRHLAQAAPNAKLAVLYQNDDYGKDYLNGIKSALGDRYDRTVVKTASFEVTDATVSSQILSLQASGADALLTAATPKFALLAIRNSAEAGWRPAPHYLTYTSSSASVVMLPAGAQNALGIITAAWIKDQGDPQWADDPGMQQWRADMKQWWPEADLRDNNVTVGYANAINLKRVLEQCGDDLSRENVMRQAANLHDVENPVLLPGIRVNTSPTNFHAIRQMRLARWSGAAWELFGQVLGDA